MTEKIPPELAELLNDVDSLSNDSAREAILRAYDLGRLATPNDHQSFLDATAQQVMAQLMSAPVHAAASWATEVKFLAEQSYDAAHALLAERTRRK